MRIVNQEPSERAAMLDERRAAKMASSSHAFVRGNTVQFYEWLAAMPALPDGPPVWICGDCHVGNLGPIADRKGRVAVQIRDLDQTTIGNPAHDLVRLALSLASVARSSDPAWRHHRAHRRAGHRGIRGRAVVARRR